MHAAERSSFDYAVVRIVPRVERSEFINAGVILFARTKKFLDARVKIDADRLRALAPNADLAEIEKHIQLIPGICSASEDSGPIGQLPQHERWHWLVAPRSTVIQVSEVHSGFSEEPEQELSKLFKLLVE